jgi:glycosyltransferase involved in cell wall biosynthesis
MQTVTVDVAGGPYGGAARFRDELYGHLKRTGRRDIAVIGEERRLDAAWLLRRELAAPAQRRRVALNNVSFVLPGGQRWTLLGNALHFLTDGEVARLDPSLRPIARQQAYVVRLAALRSHVLIAPCSAMAERIAHMAPTVKNRVIVRMHPVSANAVPPMADDPEPVILCPLVFTPYKHMPVRLREWLWAVDRTIDKSVRMLVTADESEVPADLASHPRIELLGRVSTAGLRPLWARSRAIFFPPGLESFGFPLAEARVCGRPVIARDTAQNKEIAGPALCGFTVGNPESLLEATEQALSSEITPDPAPFDPDDYFDWMLGPE